MGKFLFEYISFNRQYKSKLQYYTKSYLEVKQYNYNNLMPCFAFQVGLAIIAGASCLK